MPADKCLETPWIPLPHTLIKSSREGHKLGISRSSVRSYVVVGKTLSHVDASGLIETDFPALHDLLHLPLASLIQAAPRIARRHICVQVKVA